jgi:transcriptional regulator with XRE-family HTH domain
MEKASLWPVPKPLKDPTQPGSGSGSILRLARRNKGYSLDDLAETTGLTVAEIENIEGDAGGRPEFVKRLATVLGVLLKDL